MKDLEIYEEKQVGNDSQGSGTAEEGDGPRIGGGNGK